MRVSVTEAAKQVTRLLAAQARVRPRPLTHDHRRMAANARLLHRRDRSLTRPSQGHDMCPTHQTHSAGVADMLKLATVEKPLHLSRGHPQDPSSRGRSDPVRLWIVQMASPAVRPLRDGFRLTRGNRPAVKQLDRLRVTASEYVHGVELPSGPRRASVWRTDDDADVDAS